MRNNRKKAIRTIIDKPMLMTHLVSGIYLAYLFYPVFTQDFPKEMVSS